MTNRWDKYFYDICVAVSSKSPCLSRKIGALLVKDKSVVSLGFNGPSRGIPHCGHERFMSDKRLSGIISDWIINTHEDNMKKAIGIDIPRRSIETTCPRRLLGYESGTHMELCPAQHAEENAVSNAARNGVSVLGCTLYMNSVIPCQKCFGTLINAGIVEIVILESKVYDKHSTFLINNSLIKMREFDL